MTILSDVKALGQQIWLDNLSRSLVQSGELAEMLKQGVCGVTSNPAIFQKAFAGDALYADEVAALKQQDLTPKQRYETMAVADVQAACDVCLAEHESTGGKTGINTPQGKNLVGSFYTPAGVLADMNSLATLPNDIFIEGLGEVAKSGFIRDPEILTILENHAAELRAFDGSTFLGSPLEDVVAELIERTVTVKAYHVSSDLKEKGLREFLNYGHTLAHAIEQLEHFRWRHGNAVAVGMVYAAELAHLTGHIDQDLVDYHRSLLTSLGLPTSWNGGLFDDVLALMHRDKKARGNKLRFVVLEGVGKPIHLEDPPADAVEEAFRRIQQ